MSKMFHGVWQLKQLSNSDLVNGVFKRGEASLFNILPSLLEKRGVKRMR